MKYIQRNEESIIGDIAEHDIKALCSRLGWAVEKVTNDYGDDLLLQPKQGNRMDPFKMWIQVKGTTDISIKENKDGTFSQSLDKGNVWKWIRSRDICVLVLWDVNAQKGVFSIIKDDIEPFDLYKTNFDSLTVRIKPENTLTIDSLEKICWQARIEHYEALIAVERKSENFSSMESKTSHFSRKLLLVSEFLHIVGVLEHYGGEKTILLSHLAQSYFSNILINWKLKNPNDNEYETRSSAAALTIVCCIEKMTCYGISKHLLNDCMEFFEYFGKKFDRFDEMYSS